MKKVIVEVEEYNEYYYRYDIPERGNCLISKSVCHPMSGQEGRLTEEQADKLYDDLCTIYSHSKEEWIKEMKKKGWIIETKTAKEDAEKIAVELEKNRLANLGIYAVIEMIKYYRKAIKEAEEEKEIK